MPSPSVDHYNFSCILPIILHPTLLQSHTFAQ